MLKAFAVVAAFASLLVSAVPHTPYVRWFYPNLNTQNAHSTSSLSLDNKRHPSTSPLQITIASSPALACFSEDNAPSSRLMSVNARSSQMTSRTASRAPVPIPDSTVRSTREFGFARQEDIGLTSNYEIAEVAARAIACSSPSLTTTSTTMALTLVLSPLTLTPIPSLLNALGLVLLLLASPEQAPVSSMQTRIRYSDAVTVFHDKASFMFYSGYAYMKSP